jgi:hypothetical protein
MKCSIVYDVCISVYVVVNCDVLRVGRAADRRQGDNVLYWLANCIVVMRFSVRICADDSGLVVFLNLLDQIPCCYL